VEAGCRIQCTRKSNSGRRRREGGGKKWGTKGVELEGGVGEGGVASEAGGVRVGEKGGATGGVTVGAGSEAA